MGMKTITVGDIAIGREKPLVLIAGPCVIESEKHTLEHAARLQKIAAKFEVPFIFKSSYDKANRSALSSYRGPGIDKGLAILAAVKKECKIPVLTDVHCTHDVKKVAACVDVLQVPAFLARQPDLVVACAKTGKPVNIKKPQFMAPREIKNTVDKVLSCGNKNILLTERGTSFGYNYLVNDFRALQVMRDFGFPVIYDATHSVQLPGGKQTSSGGQSEFVVPLARAAAAFGCDGIFVEVHDAPEKALSDGANMIDFKTLEDLLSQVKLIDENLWKEKYED